MCIARDACAQKLIEMVKSTPVSRELWEFAVEREKNPIPVDKMPDAQEAFYTLYARVLSRGGHLESFRAEAVGGSEPHLYTWFSMERKIKELRRRLRYVVIEGADWRYIIRRYDKEYAFYYLDPPHHNTPYSRYYATAGVPKWTRDDFIELLDALKTLRAKWLLKYTWDEDVEREIASRGYKYLIARYRSLESGSEEKRYIFAMNYTPPAAPKPIGYVRAVEKVVF